MRIIHAADYDEMSRKAADMLIAQVLLKPHSVLGLATGSSPVGAYRRMIERYERGDLHFSAVTTVNLDEYCGLGPDDPQSYRYFMNDNLLNYIDVKPENTHVPNGLAKDAAAECARYDALIEACGGIDMQLLGIGNNGHIGFNEPADAFAKGTHQVDLARSTIEANKRFFDREDQVPRQAYTMGIRTIMHARRILLIASGKGKAQIVRDAFFGPVTPQVPASVLQLHPNVTIIGDADALSLLPQGQ